MPVWQDGADIALAVHGPFRYKPDMSKNRIRLSIKLAAFTALMVVVSMLASFYLSGAGGGDEGISAWVFIFSTVSFGVGLLYTLFLDRIITLPVQRLVRATSAMADDDYETPVPIPSNDELGRLAEATDALRRSFLAQRRSLQELNEQLDAKVHARTRELEQALEDLRETQSQLLKVEKLASIGRLAGGIAHEINNPAGVILTHTGLLLESAQEEGLSESALESIHVIDRQISRVSRITQDLLVFSRMAPISRLPLDLCELLNWNWSLSSKKARDLNIQLQGEIPPGILVWGDQAALEQVFNNLIGNALDAMEAQGGGTLSRSVEVMKEGVQLVFADTGHGIEPEILPKIFDPFFTTKKVGKGTGLGLAISYGILEELGGRLEACNRPGGGALFLVTLQRVDEGAGSVGGDGSDEGREPKEGSRG